MIQFNQNLYTEKNPDINCHTFDDCKIEMKGFYLK